MARNEEKAMSGLNRWVDQQKDVETGGVRKYGTARRPKLATEVETLKEAEFCRLDLIREVSKKISEIQNAGLGEHRIRDLNDEINKTIREKGHWEDRIKVLGGADYKAQAAQEQDSYGAELAGQSGYKYFGAAKDLPGVRELFEHEEAPAAPRKTRAALFKNIQPDYYGWRDEEDAMILLKEQEKEIELVAKEVAKWKKRKAKEMEEMGPTAQAAAKALEEAAAMEAANKKAREEAELLAPLTSQDFKAFVSVPDAEDIERLILEKKKKAILDKYQSAEQKSAGEEAKELLNKSKTGGP